MKLVIGNWYRVKYKERDCHNLSPLCEFNGVARLSEIHENDLAFHFDRYIFKSGNIFETQSDNELITYYDSIDELKYKIYKENKEYYINYIGEKFHFEGKCKYANFLLLLKKKIYYCFTSDNITNFLYVPESAISEIEK